MSLANAVVTKVKYASRKKAPLACGLYISKCYELANYYLGFNSWSISITSVLMLIDWYFRTITV